METISHRHPSKASLLRDLVNSFIMSFPCLWHYAGPKEDLHVYSGAE